jgi:branched-chain amino acid transport system substrate-binding protein
MRRNPVRRSRQTYLLAGLAAVLLTGVTACGGSDSSSGSSGKLPDTIKIESIEPLTGVVAHVGTAANQGYELAIKEINASGMLGKSKLTLDKVDTKSDPKTAASLMTQAIADKSTAAVFGSVSSAEAVAQAPLAQRAKMPTMFTSAGSDGVIVGDYTYRATPLMHTYYSAMGPFLKAGGYKSMAIMYSAFIPTLVDIGSKALPDMAKSVGITVTDTIGAQATTQDFSAQIQQVLKKKPDVVAVLEYAAANATAVTQLRQAGFTGQIISTTSASAGVLKPAGDAAKGTVWASYFSPEETAPSTQAFVKAFTTAYGTPPNQWNAEAYDAAYFMAKAWKEAGTTDHESMMRAMGKVADSGKFDGALGTGLSWEDNELQPNSILIEFDGKEEHMIPTPSA